MHLSLEIMCAEITRVALPTTVISSFHQDPTGMEQAYLHWSTLVGTGDNGDHWISGDYYSGFQLPPGCHRN